MKVLFAVSNESISESIVKKYQKEYKEIISYKNVYYFNAILKEIERDKSYDRIVISEDLEPFANNNYEAIDRFLFERLDGISDEALNGEGTDTPIILICTDRRAKSDALLLKLFSIGIYNAIIGQDRSIDEVCNLINKPRTKKDAKIYYKIEADDASYQAENEENVSEAEIQNIIAHYKKLGKNTERFVDSFNNIASQYTDQQLRVIVKFLPLNVKAVLEAESDKYQEIMDFESGKKKKKVARVVQTKARSSIDLDGKKEKAPKLEDVKIDLLENQKDDIFEPRTNIVVPSAINVNNAKKIKQKSNDEVDLDELETLEPIKIDDFEEEQQEIPQMHSVEPIQIDGFEDDEEEKVVEEPVKKKRGRPKKIVPEEELEQKPKRGRGRPKKIVPEEIKEDIEEIEPISDEYDDIETNKKSEDIKPIDLFNLTDEDDNEDLSENDEQDEAVSKIEIPEYEEEEEDKFDDYEPIEENHLEEQNFQAISMDNENLMSKNKKIVAFVGSPKNGTSFLVNNLAAQFSQMGINTAILDLTQNKNSYYIYTKNEEELRKVAFECMDKLKRGVANGIQVNKNLTVYTSLPAKEKDQSGVENVLSALVKKHSLVLMDCDLHTDAQYFAGAQEIYLVQSMDILTIQPLTAFLRDLKTKNILQMEKLRVIINKELRVKGLNPKVLIGGMSFYNEPAMTFMTELFDKEKIKYCMIPFEVDNYAKYLEALVDCNISINAYSKTFVANLKALANLVYPLLSRQHYESNVVNNNYGSKESDTKVKKLFKFNK